MTGKITLTLQQYEEMISRGEISSFTICVKKGYLTITPTGSGTKETIPLDQELHHSLSTFFFQVESIEYASFDYSTLKSLLNTYACLERIVNNEPGKSL